MVKGCNYENGLPARRKSSVYVRKAESLCSRASMKYVFILIIMAALQAGCSEDKVVTTVDLYFMQVTETRIKLASETRDFDGPQPGLVPVIETWLQGPQSLMLSRVVPENVRLLNGFIQNSTAYLDFSSEITRAVMGGEWEAVLVQAIVLTASQVPGVESVQIMVEGEIVESLAGHMLINRPIKIDI